MCEALHGCPLSDEMSLAADYTEIPERIGKSQSPLPTAQRRSIACGLAVGRVSLHTGVSTLGSNLRNAITISGISRMSSTTSVANVAPMKTGVDFPPVHHAPA